MLTCCSLPRVSVNLRSAHFTSLSLISLMTSLELISPPGTTFFVRATRRPPAPHAPRTPARARPHLDASLMRDPCRSKHHEESTGCMPSRATRAADDAPL